MPVIEGCRKNVFSKTEDLNEAERGHSLFLKLTQSPGGLYWQPQPIYDSYIHIGASRNNTEAVHDALKMAT